MPKSLNLFQKVPIFFLKAWKTDSLQSGISRLIADRVKKLSPDEALRFLFRIEELVYALAGPVVKDYGKGVHSKHRHTNYHDFFVSHLRASERVLDVGSGEGVVAADLVKKIKVTVDAIDYDAGKIAKAKEKFSDPNLRFWTQDAMTFKPEKRYDVVLLSNVLEHLNDRSTFLRRIVKQTRAKRLLIRVPSFERDWRVPLKKELGVEWRLDLDHKIEYTRDEFIREMKNANLSVTHIEDRWGEIWAELKPLAKRK